ncbi:MAG: SDR family oxidoreductase [Acidobacteriia bacterium]|nr:SDR family oxidoreductase [Terriglobia bacterium]MBV8904661.1 SDR family oxidoreductase [Terriglobia bacterium]MBV9743689.1 SDR family oxidoreductase [Terriglobia bacterium]
MESLVGKIAIVTGGTRGIGRAIVERLLEDKVSVMFCGRTRESVDRTLNALVNSGGQVCGQVADITSPEAVSQLFEAADRAFGGLDILVNNAGAGIFHKVAEMSIDDWRRNIDLNLNAAFYCSREALARFLPRGGGFIVNISSLAGANAFSGGAGYNASKFGLNGFSEAMMFDHRYDNVRVTYVMPGSVDTGFSGGPSNRTGDTSWMIRPEDVAEMVACVLRMPGRTTISRVEMRPSRPKK